VSSVFKAPAYQGGGSGGMRTVPDVASNADPFTGDAVFSAGDWTVVGGTSAAAPMWAGFTALHDALSHGRLGNANPAYYAIAAGPAYGTAFNDITDGSNGAFDAGPGYDEVTGLGSYDGAQLHAVLH
jgi:kumamolisin